MKAPQTPAALVTGGASGIGFSIARALLQRGMNVSICGRNERKLEVAARELGEGRGHGERVEAARVDVSKAAEVKRWVAAAKERFGPPALLVNNAGVGAWGEVGSLAEEAW